MRYSKEDKPCTGYPLSEDTCDQRIDYVLCMSDKFVQPCPEDNVLTDVGKSLVYQMGPTASNFDASGEPFYGLYQITIYFPAEAGGQSYLPLVYHNDTYVSPGHSALAPLRCTLDILFIFYAPVWGLGGG